MEPDLERIAIFTVIKHQGFAARVVGNGSREIESVSLDTDMRERSQP